MGAILVVSRKAIASCSDFVCLRPSIRLRWFWTLLTLATTTIIASAQPAPIIITDARISGGTFSFSFDTEAGEYYHVEYSDTLSFWSELMSIAGTGEPATVSVEAISPIRFFRVRAESAPVFSVNVVAYQRVPIGAGLNLIANPFRTAGNSIRDVLPVMPDSTTLFKVGTSGFECSLYFMDEFDWLDCDTGNPSTTTLGPGEGALLCATAPTTVTFVGEVPEGSLTNKLPSGLSLCSSIAPQSGTLSSVLGFPAAEGDLVYKFNRAAGSFNVYYYFDSVWGPSEPSMSPGEAFWVKLGSSRNWGRQFSVEGGGSAYTVTNRAYAASSPPNPCAGGPTPPSITTQPISQRVPLGGTATFSVGATGTAPLRYQWVRNNVNITGATNAVYTIPAVQLSDAGSYRAVVSNSAGSANSATATLTVVTPPHVTRITPQTTNVPLGGFVRFCVDVDVPGPFQIRWRQNGVNLPNETNLCLQIDSVQLSHGGAYSVEVGNEAGVDLSATAFLLLDLPRIQGSDFQTNQTQLIGPSGQLTATNKVTGSDPGEPRHFGKPGGSSIWYSWRPQGTGIATFRTVGSTFDTLLAVYILCSPSNLVEIASDEDSGGSLTSLVRYNAIAGTNYLIVVDGFAGAQGNFALSWDFEPTLAFLPVILAHPQSQTVAPGQSAAFTVNASVGCTNGYPGCGSCPPNTNGLKYQWFFNGAAISNATTATFFITNVQDAAVGTYTVTVTDSTRTVTSRAASLQMNLTSGQTQPVQAQNKFVDAVEAVPIELGTRNITPGPLRMAAAAGGGSVVRGYTGTQVFNTSGSSGEPGDLPICASIGGASQWITFVVLDTGVLHLDTDGSSYDTVMAVFVRSQNNPNVLQMIACDNNSGSDHHDSALSVPALAGGTNFIMIDGVQGQTGTLHLNYSLVTASTLTALGNTQGGNSQVRVSGHSGMRFTLEGSTNGVNWIPIVTTNSPADFLDYLDTTAPSAVKRFYRALMLP